jgi:hypothetical protein
MIFFILAAGNSGTTLISQILHQSGVNMIDEGEATWDSQNLYEHLSRKKLEDLGVQQRRDLTAMLYERVSMNSLNQALLANQKHPPRSGVSIMHYIPKSPIIATDDQLEEMRELIHTCSQNYEHWGFKDPRNCHTYPIWERELPPHRLIFIYRGYSEIVRRSKLSGIRQIEVFRLRNLLKAWVYLNGRLLKFMKATPYPYLLLRFEAFMSDENEFKRLERFVGRPLVDLRNPKLHHSRMEKPNLLPFLGKIVSQWLPIQPEEILIELENMPAQKLIDLEIRGQTEQNV